MDPNTVYRHLQLSDGGHKAVMRAENLNPPDHPERFLFWRQVLCSESLGGSPYYWEVEWTGQKVGNWVVSPRHMLQIKEIAAKFDRILWELEALDQKKIKYSPEIQPQLGIEVLHNNNN